MQKQQTMAGGETLSFDYTFDIPVEVAAAVCKYRHDRWKFEWGNPQFTRLYVAIGSDADLGAHNCEVRFTPAPAERTSRGTNTMSEKCQKRKSPVLLLVATPERPLQTSQKKGRRPLNQPKGCHRADRVRRDHVEPIDCPPNQGRFEAKRYCCAEQAAHR
jgi:hypothetical protein